MLSVTSAPPLPALPEAFNLAAYVLAPAQKNPDKIALAVLGPQRARRWSYAQLERAVRGVATGLIETGLAPGDRVLLRLGNTVDFPLAYLGALAAGMVPVPTAEGLTVPEITAIAEAAVPKLILHAEGVSLPRGQIPVLGLDDLNDMQRAKPADYHFGSPHRLGYIVFTSGTMGKAQGVAHAHRAILARRMMWDGWYGLTSDDRVLHAGAFNWTFTLGTGVLDPLSCGATSLIPAAGTPIETLPLLLKRHEATLFAAAPGVFRKLLKAPEKLVLPRLRHGLSAGEKLPDSIRDGWNEATGTDIHEAYGMSECSTFVSGAPWRPAPAGTLGYPQSGRMVAVLGRDANPVDRGKAGTLAVHTSDPGLMLGYLVPPSRPDGRFVKDWFLTGDRAIMTEDGALDYLGREDDMMNAGGFRVSPLEVEAAIEGHPKVGEAAAIELPIKADASVIAVAYTATDPIPDAALHAHAAARLARYKQPRLYRHLPNLPRSANGKLQRGRVRDILRSRHGQA